MNIFPQSVHDRLRLAHGWYDVMRSGFWFVDIPRTSSSSIRSELGHRYGIAHGKRNLDDKALATEQVFDDHRTAVEMRQRLGRLAWNYLFTFSLVRNPWDRTHSYYHFQLKKGFIPGDWTFRDYLLVLENVCPGEQYFKFGFNSYGASDFLFDEQGRQLVDFIGRYENRTEDLKYIASRINFPGLGLLHTQRSTPEGCHYAAAYDEETRQIVARRYAKDIELFGYRFDG